MRYSEATSRWQRCDLNTCRGCRGARLDPVFQMDPMPLAGAFAATRDGALQAERFPLSWLWCNTCGLVNVAPDIPDSALYGTYHYASSDVPALVRHFTDFAALLKTRFGTARVLEIGCNDGVLLKRLPKEWDKVGVDPSDIAAAMRGDYALYNQPYTSDLAAELGRFDLVLTSNSLAHFTDLADALEGLTISAKGEVWIEVHDLQATLRSGQWDTVYHEHKVEWSVDALLHLMARHGFEPIGVTVLPLHGGLLRAGFRQGRADIPAPGPPDCSILQSGYLRRRESEAYRLLLGANAVAYGAAGRASVFFNQIPELEFRYVVDGSPQRSGRYVPGAGYPVVPPEQFEADQPPLTLISAWNHAADIHAAHPAYTGRWLSAFE